jgi:hypothetical protein
MSNDDLSPLHVETLDELKARGKAALDEFKELVTDLRHEAMMLKRRRAQQPRFGKASKRSRVGDRGSRS